MKSPVGGLVIVPKNHLKGKWIITLMMALSLAVTGAFRLVLLYVVVQKASILKLSTNYMELTYYVSFLSRASGSFSGGISFDYWTTPYEKQGNLSLNAQLLFVFALIMLPIRQPAFLIMTVIVCEFFLASLNTNICSYCLFLWPGDRPQYFQGIQFFYALGIFSVAWYSHDILFSFPRNKISQEVSVDYIMFYSENAILALVSILWMVLSFILYFHKSQMDAYFYIPEFQKINYREMPLVYFSVIFILTTCLSCMISAVAFGYPMILTSLEKIAALNTTALQDTGTLYWGIFAFARFFCTILSLKLSSAQIIGFGIFVLLCAGALQLVHDLQSHTMICVMSGLVAFGASCIYPTTFLYLHQYIPISAKMMAILFIAGYLAEMTIPLWLGKMVEEDITNISHYILSLSVSYAILFAILYYTMGIKKWEVNKNEKETVHMESIENVERQPPKASTMPPNKSTEQSEKSAMQPDKSAAHQKHKSEDDASTEAKALSVHFLSF
ncbi:sodium-dependent glucose transporter 1-like [Parasteatoda tepidariorum]|uniref:sodium-dependent glucose transporter 1-like n=1 Tax=Parasteatoda tepidariorum TaxID=114398 RepID=UPI0039BC29C5